MSDSASKTTRILVVDDEDIVQESVRLILEENGFSVDSARREKEALNLLDKGPYDLVLTDLMMPEGHGMEVVKAVAAKFPNTAVIIFTGYPELSSVVQSLKLGTLDYLPKPFSPDELLQSVRRALAQSAAGSRLKEMEQTFPGTQKALVSSLDLKELLGLICEQVLALTQAKGAALLFLKPKDTQLEMVSSRGIDDTLIGTGSVSGEMDILHQRRPTEPITIQAADFQTALEYPEETREEGIHAIVSAPVSLKSETVGFLRVYFAEHASFSDAELHILSQFAAQAGRALDNAVAYERLRKDIQGMKKTLASAP